MGAVRPSRFTPPALRAGDRVRVIAPASPVQPDLLDAGLQLIESWDLAVDDASGAYARAAWPLGHLAGDDQHRASELVDALTEPGVAAVLCARGGTALGRVLEHLTDSQWDRIAAAAPRWVVGSSDITALHCAIAARVGWATLFGPMLATDVLSGNRPDEISRGALRQALFGEAVRVSAEAVLSDQDLQTIVAPVIGGTITVIESLLATPEAGSARGCIALLEDIGEAPRRLDRSLTHLRRAGWFMGVRAVVVGTLIDCGESARDVVLERVSDLGVPVFTGVSVGHGPSQLCLPLGADVAMDVGAATLTWWHPESTRRVDAPPRA